jgi:galactose mutarotase-like enzyme
VVAPEQQRGFDVWTVRARDGQTSASIVPALGGAVSSLRFPGPRGPEEWLFLHEFFWDAASVETRGGLPFLFPICGRLACDGEAGAWRHEGRLRRLPIHGFAMRRPWVVRDASQPDALVLGQEDGPDTHEGYPFRFDVQLRWAVEPGVLRCEQRYTNRGHEPMPYAAGFHPYFRTPPPPEKRAVRVSVPAARRHYYNDTFTSWRFSETWPGGVMSPADPHFSSSIFELGAERTVAVAWPDGRRVRMEARGITQPGLFPFLQCYTAGDRPFVCVEPWMSPPNSLPAGAHMRWLEPGAADHAVVEWRADVGQG